MSDSLRVKALQEARKFIAAVADEVIDGNEAVRIVEVIDEALADADAPAGGV